MKKLLSYIEKIYINIQGGDKEMKVLIVGAGGREHAIAWKISQNEKVEKNICSTRECGS